MKKRILSTLLAVIVTMSVIFSVPNLAEAVSCVKTQSEAVAWLKAQEGNKYDLDHAYGGQCSDFSSAYVNYVLYGNAYAGKFGVYNANQYSNANLYPSDWQVIKNTASFVPQPGDIFITKGSTSYGHTGVVISSDVINAVVADQNGMSDWSLDKGSPAHIHSIKWTSSGTWAPTYFVRPKFSSNTEAPHTHSYNTYAYCWEKHPHYQCFKCSCGAIQADFTKISTGSNCAYCNGRITYNLNGGTSYLSGKAESVGVDKINGSRDWRQMVVYSSDYKSVTATNQYGTELAFDNNGKFAGSRLINDTNGLKIPSNGFVVSGHDTCSDKLCEIRNWVKYAYCDYNNKKVYFYSNETDYKIDQKYLNVNSAFGMLPTAVRSGYTFDGWYDKENGGNRVDSSTLYNGSNKVLYAHWSKYQEVVQPTQCQHYNIAVLNTKSATYFEKGYTGDTFCYDCNKLISIGVDTAKKVLKTPTGLKTTAGKKKVTVSYKKVSGAKGYKITYKLGKTSTTVTTTKLKFTIKNLKSKKTYTITVKAYVKSGKKIAYSDATKAKKVKIK